MALMIDIISAVRNDPRRDEHCPLGAAGGPGAGPRLGRSRARPPPRGPDQRPGAPQIALGGRLPGAPPKKAAPPWPGDVSIYVSLGRGRFVGISGPIGKSRAPWGKTEGFHGRIQPGAENLDGAPFSGAKGLQNKPKEFFLGGKKRAPRRARLLGKKRPKGKPG